MRRTLRAAAAVLALIPHLVLAAPDIALHLSIDVSVPTAGQPVQFTVTVSNLGPDAASGVQVTDRLPTELAIPAGMAAFPSAGDYDSANGVWSVGSLAVGASATLVIPAVVVVANQPACIVNIAQFDGTPDSNSANDRASVALRRSAADRCVDLSVYVGATYVPFCVTSNRISSLVRVRNAGPDAASNLLVDLSQDPAAAPRLRLTGPDGATGTTCSGTRCAIASLAAGATIDLQGISDPFLNQTQQRLTLGVAASSTDTDHATANNQSAVSVLFPAVSAGCEEIDVDEGWGVPVSGSGCFVATAARGSGLEAHLAALRNFRDRYLRRSVRGRAFVGYYYRHSRSVAEIIARHESLRLVARATLAPVVLAVAYPSRALAAVLLTAVALVGWCRRREPRN